MAITDTQRAELCRYAGVPTTDAQSVAVLEGSWERARQWYKDAGCDLEAEGIEYWLQDLATWFFDNRGRDDADLPSRIVKSVHHFR